MSNHQPELQVLKRVTRIPLRELTSTTEVLQSTLPVRGVKLTLDNILNITAQLATIKQPVCERAPVANASKKLQKGTSRVNVNYTFIQ